MSNIEHPSHYGGSIECIDAIKACLSKEEFAGFCKGNIIKYLWRYKHKNGYEDLMKADKYTDWLLETERKITKDEDDE